MANNIRVEYHQAAGLPPRIFAFRDFRQEKRTPDIVVSKSNPWKPFKTRLDFELAEFTQKASLNKQLINSLFKLVKDIVSKPTNLTLESADDVNCVWESATLYHSSFTSTSISQPYKGEDKVFDFYSRPLWEWVLSQVQDPLLAPYMEWDAQRLSKFDGTKWVCFYDKPWTARKVAEVQSDISRVRSNGKPLAIILWADTSVLSTSGTQKGHYIVARVGNLPMWIQNGRSFGGGRVVGFLPIVQGMVGEQKKPGFVNWKNAVYHKVFEVFLEDVAHISKLGQTVLCGDDVFCVLFPYIHILSADYEEQCHFALIRGLNGLAPCPVCLVPKGTLSDLRTRYQYRSAVENEVLVRLTAPSAEKEYELKSRGLRNVENALWAVANTDVHQALSYDRLHVDIKGMFQKHILPEIKTELKHLGRRAQVEFDETYMNMARWSDLAHFKHGILTLDFSDGGKWADVARILIHAAHNVMSEAKSPKGFALLKVFRKWHELNMYLLFEVHTEETIPAYNRTLNTFHDRLAEYIDLNEGNDLTDIKDWNRIIKLHVHVHAARDIRMKGVIANMDTKVNENLNGPMRNAYWMQTNFKNVEPQLGKIEDRAHVCCFTRACINAMDDASKDVQPGQPTDEESDGLNRPRDAWIFGHVYVGSRRKTIFRDFAGQSTADDAFINLRWKLADCLRDLMSRTTAAGGIINCSHMLVDYEHKVSWKTAMDHLYCKTHQDYEVERFDCALVHMSDTKVMYCRLVRILVYFTGEQKFALALVQPMISTIVQRGDAELGLCRLWEKSRQDSMVVPARSIIRGAVLVPDCEHNGEYTLIDCLDTDQFLRSMPLFPNRDMEMLL
ncbi:hypothetical protein BC835DRAFT_1293143 [Cytidiella melzeri]|nr:hypothetical protein BC835DRAFT_1293143 [Cytidiella melzeri]